MSLRSQITSCAYTAFHNPLFVTSQIMEMFQIQIIVSIFWQKVIHWTEEITLPYLGFSCVFEVKNYEYNRGPQVKKTR